MGVPRFHQYIYTSQRLLTDTYHESQAVGRRWRIESLKLTTPMFSMSASQAAPTPENPYWLAEMSLEALGDDVRRISELEQGRRHQYVYIPEFPLRWLVLPVLGLDQAVAWVHGRDRDDEAGYTVLALAGSLSNYCNMVPNMDLETPELGWYPSSMEGLTSIFHAAAREHVFDDLEQERGAYEPEDLLTTAETISAMADHHVVGEAHVEVLAVTYLVAHSLKRDWWTNVYDTFIVGAPLWIRTTPPTHPPRQKGDTTEKLGSRPDGDNVSQGGSRQPQGRLSTLRKIIRPDR